MQNQSFYGRHSSHSWLAWFLSLLLESELFRATYDCNTVVNVVKRLWLCSRYGFGLGSKTPLFCTNHQLLQNKTIFYIKLTASCWSQTGDQSSFPVPLRHITVKSVIWLLVWFCMLSLVFPLVLVSADGINWSEEHLAKCQQLVWPQSWVHVWSHASRMITEEMGVVCRGEKESAAAEPEVTVM